MKSIFQNLIKNYPTLKRNRYYYYIQKYRQLKPCKVDYSLTDRSDVLDDLVEDGIALVENYVQKEVCEKIISELDESVDQIFAGTFKGEGDFNDYQLEQKAIRIHNVDTISKTAKEIFFDDKMIQNMAKAYVSERATSYRREADLKLEAGHFLSSDLPHFDDWRHRFKAFLYLTDVDADNGPFFYYKGSHKPHPWKEKYHLEYEIEGEKGRYGHFFWQEMEKIQKERNYEEFSCIGKAGTLIFADFRGIHKGTTLKSGRRILLNNTFGITL